MTYVEIIPSIDIPLDVIAWPLWRKRLEPMRLADLGPFIVRSPFMLLVMSMIRVELFLVSDCFFPL